MIELNYETLKSLTSEQVILLNKLAPLVEEAKRMQRIVDNSFCFHTRQNQIVVLQESNSHHEYLTHDGVWKYRYDGKEYQIKTDAESLFENLKAECLLENDLIPRIVNNGWSKETEMVYFFGYFRKFLDRIQKVME